jgi:hypothetical protein
MKNLPIKAVAFFANLLIKEVIETADNWTQAQMDKTKKESAHYAAEVIKYKARQELIAYLTRSYGELND